MTTVLIVDDNPMDRRFAGACVEESGMSATYAEHGKDALEKLDAEKPDIVLTDLDMPEMDGLALVRDLQRRDPTLPVILMTAKGSEEIAAEALAAGASSYVPKKNFQQEVMAALQIEPGTPFDPKAFEAFLSEQDDLGTKWAPRYVRISDALPMTPTNKVLKRVLRKQRWECEDPVWWRPEKGAPCRRLDEADRRTLARRFEERGRRAALSQI